MILIDGAKSTGRVTLRHAQVQSASTRRAGLSRDDIGAALDQRLRTELIVVVVPSVIERALSAYRNGTGDFADYLVREQARANDAREVATFDRSLKGEDGFRVM